MSHTYICDELSQKLNLMLGAGTLREQKSQIWSHIFNLGLFLLEYINIIETQYLKLIKSYFSPYFKKCNRKKGVLTLLSDFPPTPPPWNHKWAGLKSSRQIWSPLNSNIIGDMISPIGNDVPK